MSHYIQDTQAVIKTSDNVYLLLTKGGDNNVSSAETNKRCTSWSFDKAFDSKEAFDNFIDTIMKSDVSGGSWQFKSLKNKTFNGFTEYENTIYKRFEKAFKKAIEIEFDLTTLDTTNVGELQRLIERGLIKNKHSMKDQDGCSQSFCIARYSSSADEDAVKYLSNRWTKIENDDYREFCRKYSEVSKYEAFKDEAFCEALNSFKIRWGGTYSLQSADIVPITCQGFVNLYKDEHETLLGKYEHDINNLLANYPYHFYHLFNTTSILKDMKNHIDNLKGDDKKYSEKHYTESLMEFEKFMKTKHLGYKVIADKRAEDAPFDFIKIWNSLEVRSWYKQTGQYIPIDLLKMQELLKIGSFKLDDVKGECSANFYKIISHHRNQMIKNKKAVALLAKELIENYSILLNENSINSICEYFELKKPTLNIIPVVMEAKSVSVAHAKGVLF